MVINIVWVTICGRMCKSVIYPSVMGWPWWLYQTMRKLGCYNEMYRCVWPPHMLSHQLPIAADTNLQVILINPIDLSQPSVLLAISSQPSMHRILLAVGNDRTN